ESFRTWDPAVLTQLPMYVQESFPFILTKKSAVHKDIVNDLRDDVVRGGKSYRACSDGIGQMHLVRYHGQEMKYYSKLLWDRKIPSVGIPVKEEIFSEFGNRRYYNGFSPFAHYLRPLWTEVQERRPVAKLDKYRRQQQIDGTVLSMDGSYKFVKFVRVRDGKGADARPIYCVMTVFNEFEQMAHALRSVSAAMIDRREIKEDLKLLLRARYRDSGFKLPRVVYTDLCCDDRQLLREILNELRDKGWEYRLADPEPTGPEQPLYKIPDDVDGVCVRASQQKTVLEGLCQKLDREIAANGHVMGLDIEWGGVLICCLP
ncbi:unnamed protein product, partial [Sphacelaria rigidula]